MTPTNEQIKVEARRRAIKEFGDAGPDFLDDFIIEVMREGWTPPEPVDPDLLAFREWFADRNDPVDRAHILAGHWDSNFVATYFLAGARIAREQERERAKVLLEYVKGDTVRLDGYGSLAREILAKYEEGGR